MPNVSRRRNGGFSYIEILVGIAILAIVAGGVAQGLALASSRIGDARVDTVASKLAGAQVDEAHRMPYADVGVVGGNPPGTIPATRTETVRGVDYRVDVDVDYVDDPALGQPQTFVNYKRVTVKVTPLTDGGDAPVTESSLIAPPAISAISGKSAVVVSVIDAITDDPVRGLGVTVDQGPSPARTDTTDVNGKVVFAGLDPSALDPADPRYKYRLTVPAGEYIVHPDDGPDVKQQHLTAGQTWETTIRVFKPSQVVVNLIDGVTGGPVTERANVTVQTPAPDSRSEPAVGATGTFTFTTIGGKPIQPSLSAFTVTATAECYQQGTTTGPVPSFGYPANTTGTFNLTLQPIPHGYIDVTVVDDASGAPITNARAQVSGGSLGVSPRVRDVTGGAVSYCIEPSGSTPYVVSVVAPGYGEGSMQAIVNESQRTPVTFRLVRGDTGDIQLNAPGPNQLVRLRAVAGTYDANQLTNSSSLAVFRNLAAGDYMAYIAVGFSDGLPVWSPGKLVRADANTLRAYAVP